ncbi:hypothetical protein ACJX0J_005844, partial [Zea mays]
MYRTLNLGSIHFSSFYGWIWEDAGRVATAKPIWSPKCLGNATHEAEWEENDEVGQLAVAPCKTAPMPVLQASKNQILPLVNKWNPYPEQDPPTDIAISNYS